jgi:cytochrome P450
MLPQDIPTDTAAERAFPVASGIRALIDLGWCMAKKREPVDELLDALVWMRRKAKRHAPVDDLIDALMKMRRQAKKKLAKRKVKKPVPAKSKPAKRKSRRK